MALVGKAKSVGLPAAGAKDLCVGALPSIQRL
jgi:hypothetical protein